jgi:DNA-binding NarL/FixJ family response regulator
MVKILLADDHAVVREGLLALFERAGFTTAEASDGQQAIERAATFGPDVVVLDLSMKAMNGIEAAEQLVRKSPRTRCMALTRHAEDRFVLAAFRAGMRGYVLKSQPVSDLIGAVRQVARGEFYVSPSVSPSVVEKVLSRTPVPEERLTARERQVVRLIGEGETTRTIASRLGISVKTAESHRTRLMQKLDIHCTANLVRYAMREGLLGEGL